MCFRNAPVSNHRPNLERRGTKGPSFRSLTTSTPIEFIMKVVTGIVVVPLFVVPLNSTVKAFQPSLGCALHHQIFLASTSLNSTPQRKPRRSLQKRRKRNKEVSTTGPQQVEDDFPWDTAESRPLIKSEAQELGEDYWIAEEDLKKVQDRSKPPDRLEGQVSDEKLWDEVLSPYRQNWIGVFSVLVVVLAVIVSQFPELIQSPLIPIPDL